jgi:CBS-domain-containing membrane protein
MSSTTHKNGAWHHLSQKTCGDLSIDMSMIKSVRGNDSLESVVKALKSRDVLSAPVLDDKQRVLGVIDLTDLLSLLVRELAVSSELTFQSAAQIIFLILRNTKKIRKNISHVAVVASRRRTPSRLSSACGSRTPLP